MNSLNSHELNLRIDGPVDAPVVVFANSLGTDIHLWDDTALRLQDQLRLVRFDYPGHGQAPLRPVNSAGAVASDLLRALTKCGVDRFVMCGVSLGGAVGLEVALRAPQRVMALMMSNTAMHFATSAFWNNRMETAATHGMSAIADTTVTRWLTGGQAHPSYKRLRRSFEATQLAGYLQCAAIVRDYNSSEVAKAVVVPTTVVVGLNDLATPPASGEDLAKQIPGAKLVAMPTAHLACADRPDEFAELLRTQCLGVY